MSDVFKALSDPTRRAILQLLRSGPMTAGALAERFEISRPAMSAHFSVLREANLVASEKAGKNVVYRLKLSVLEEAMLAFAQTMQLGQPADGRRGDRRASAPIGEQP
jgi:DNA-binding transcriptional ArsR family regulator